MELRIYHMEEQLQRSDADAAHRDSVTAKLSLCQIQRSELSNALQQLLDNIANGQVRHRTYRQMKMYNDPALNPYIYDKDKVSQETGHNDQQAGSTPVRRAA